VLRLILFQRENTDVVLFNELPALSFLFLRLFRKITGKRRPLYIMDTRSLVMPPEDKMGLKDHLKVVYLKLITWLSNHFLDARTAITPRMAASLRVPEEKLVGVWPSGVDLSPFSERPEWYGVGELDRIRLIYIGSMHYERNLMALSQAVHRASQQGISFELVLIGDGEEYGDLQAYSEMTDDVVRVYPPIPHSQIPGWLQESHIGVLPFPDEEKFRVSSPIKLFEYMAAGLPVMATRIVCHTDVVGAGKYIFWVEGSDCEALLDTLGVVWSKRGVLQEMGEQAVRAAEGWTWEKSAEKLHRALHHALDLLG
jgi:glycosyltransferase involved in cell wall biosynthesis